MAAAVAEEIPDEQYERVVERVCAIDVAKASGKVCVRVPRQGRPGRVSGVWDVPATTAAVVELAGLLVGQGIEKVTVESTSDYWRIWYYLLEAAGLDVQLVNAREVKNVPGRPKTDKLDAVWLAKLTEKGLLRASFVPLLRVKISGKAVKLGLGKKILDGSSSGVPCRAEAAHRAVGAGWGDVGR